MYLWDTVDPEIKGFFMNNHLCKVKPRKFKHLFFGIPANSI